MEDDPNRTPRERQMPIETAHGIVERKKG